MSEGCALVAGCGFLGAEVARRLAAEGWEVTGCTHSAESAAALAGEPFKVVAGDFTRAEEAARWGTFDTIIHSASSRRGGADEYRHVYFEGLRTLIETCAPARVVFVSSTSVYAQTDGSIVTEESDAAPTRETGRILREAEELALAAGGAITRLAGIYGRGRSVLLKKFFSGEARIEGSGERWLNQIHRDDAASAIAAIVRARATGIFNVADDTPLTQRALYAYLAERFARPLPPEGPIDLNRKRGWTHKRVSNAKLRGLGWAPKYRSFFDAVAADAEMVRLAQLSE
jgi:nucleoside-diphosphate-sugar epimerase